jgi:hypothetical protein
MRAAEYLFNIPAEDTPLLQSNLQTQGRMQEENHLCKLCKIPPDSKDPNLRAPYQVLSDSIPLDRRNRLTSHRSILHVDSTLQLDEDQLIWLTLMACGRSSNHRLKKNCLDT